MTNFLHLAIAALVILFLALQVLDVISTVLALRQPNVIEVGDTAIGLGNISGWAQKTLGPFWPIIKLPLFFTAALIWAGDGPPVLEVFVLVVLILANYYFVKIVWQNFINAKVMT